MSLRPHEVDEMLAALWRSLSPRQERKLAEVWEGFASGRRRAGDEPEE